MVKLKDVSKRILRVPITLSKDKKHEGWVVPRAETYELIPKLSYERGCDVLIDGIPARARLSILFRLFFSRNKENILAEYLDDITDGEEAEIDMQILLNSNEFLEFQSSNDYKKIAQLEQKFSEYRKSSEDMKNYLISVNEELFKKIDMQNELIDDLKKDNSDLSKFIGELEEKNKILEKRIKYLDD